MRIVIDTNVLVSALLNEFLLPAQLLGHWRRSQLQLVTSNHQLDEFGRVTRYPKLRALLSAAKAGRLVNDLRELADVIERLPAVTDCQDANDNFLLATILAGSADFLVTGDKADLLSMERYAGAAIVSVRRFFEVNKLN